MKKMGSVFTLFIASVWVVFSAFKQVEEPSKMSKLMQQMLGFIKTEKENIANGKEMQDYPRYFNKMKTAKVTEGKKLAENHKEFLTNFYEGLENYYKAGTTLERKESFNLLVNNCITCHQYECPGPISTIQKNIIE